MQSRSKPMDDLANLVTNAVGAVKGVGDEVKAMGRSQAERMIADLDLVGRDEFEVLKSLVQKTQSDNETLKKKVASLERQLKALKK